MCDVLFVKSVISQNSISFDVQTDKLMFKRSSLKKPLQTSPFKVLIKIRESSLDTHLFAYDVERFAEFFVVVAMTQPRRARPLAPVRRKNSAKSKQPKSHRFSSQLFEPEKPQKNKMGIER